MNDITIPQVAGAILDGVQRRVIPLSHSELTAVTKECMRLRQKPVQPRMTHKWGELDKYKAQPVGGAKGAVMGLWGLVLVIVNYIGGKAI